MVEVDKMRSAARVGRNVALAGEPQVVLGGNSSGGDLCRVIPGSWGSVRPASRVLYGACHENGCIHLFGCIRYPQAFGS